MPPCMVPVVLGLVRSVSSLVLLPAGLMKPPSPLITDDLLGISFKESSPPGNGFKESSSVFLLTSFGGTLRIAISGQYGPRELLSAIILSGKHCNWVDIAQKLAPSLGLINPVLGLRVPHDIVCKDLQS